MRNKEKERLKIEKEVKENLAKELRIRLQEEAEEEKRKEATEVELATSPARLRQKPCRHGYSCRMYWVSWSHCERFYHPNNMGVWDQEEASGKPYVQGLLLS